MMWTIRDLGRGSHHAAVENARAATTELSRRRVEREDVELFLAGLDEGRTSATRPA